jgi:DNA-binding transcriptional LysR family regulator
VRSEQLEYVAAIARLGSYRRAAEELHISQPALSATVRNLERELGVDILARGRSGAQVSDQGRELLPYIVGVIESVDHLRRVADAQHRARRVVRVGTVNAATVPLLTEVMRAFRNTHPETEIQVVGAQGPAIETQLREGALDLGLLTSLEGDDAPPDLESTLLLRGRAVVVFSPENPLARLHTVSVEALLSEPMILMRSGYLMHRYVHRLLGDRLPEVSYSTDGAEMGKLMAAEGLGVCVLPSFSVLEDPLTRHGVITWRPLTDDTTEVQLVIRRRRSDLQARAAEDLHRLFLETALGLRAAGLQRHRDKHDDGGDDRGEHGPGRHLRPGTEQLQKAGDGAGGERQDEREPPCQRGEAGDAERQHRPEETPQHRPLEPQQPGRGVMEVEDLGQAEAGREQGHPQRVPADPVTAVARQIDDADVQVGEAEQEDPRVPEDLIRGRGGGDQVEGDGNLQRPDEQVEDGHPFGVDLAQEQQSVEEQDRSDEQQSN